MIEGNNILIKKLDGFIRKYYINLIIKGVILSVAIALLYYFIVALAEYFGRFTVTARTILFYSSIVFLFGVFTYFIVMPVFKLAKIGRRITHKQAAIILGKFFPNEIGDKLQNTLELFELVDVSPAQRDLIIASVEKRMALLTPLPFLHAVRLKQNVKYIKYLVPLVAVFISVLVVWPAVITEGTVRILNYNNEFIPPPPFVIQLDLDSLTVRKGEDFTIRMKTVGDMAPEEMKIYFGGNSFYMEKESAKVFTYTLKNLNNPIRLHAEAANIKSSDYQVTVLPAPVILDFTVDVNPPAYTGMEPKQYENTGDITIPFGSVLEWRFNTDNVGNITMLLHDSLRINAVQTGKLFSINKRVLSSSTYILQVANEYFNDKDKISYNLNVIPDLFPAIEVISIQDSLNLNIYYFSGNIDDDYGFNNLTFNYNPQPNTDTVISVPISISKNMSSQEFYYAFDFSEVESSGRISYYFEVGDNDAIQGSKKTRSKIYEYVLPTLDDIEDKTSETLSSIDDKIDEAQRLTKEIREDIAEMQQKLVNDEMSDWERQQMMEQIADKQKQLDNVLQEVAQEQQDLNNYKGSSQKQSQEMMQKQKEMQELLDQIMDDEMRQLMKELQDLMKDFDKEQFNQMAKEMEMSYDDLSKQMDQNMELLKRMEVEERVNNTIEKLDNLADKQEKLAESSFDKEADPLKNQEEQAKLNEELNEVKKDYEETLDKNSSLEEPYDLDSFDEEFNKLQEDMKGTEQEMQDNKTKKAGKMQQQNAQNMQELSEAMQQMMDMNMQMQMQENMSDLRQVIENLIDFSFEQEAILNDLNNVNSRDPRYRQLVAKQKKISDDFNIINDSLNAMSARMSEVGAIIRDEVGQINSNLVKILDALAGTAGFSVRTDQQLVMTSANNLALLLSEVMESMQQQMANQMNGNQNCQNCKNTSQGKMGQMRDMQKGMKQQMQQMIDQMKQNGGKEGQGQPQNSKDLAKMIAQQEIMQQMMNDMMNSGGLDPESVKVLNEINKLMDQNMRDLINGNVDSKVIDRQELILTRMLEVEESDRERELDDKRKSNEAKEKKISNPEEAFKEKEKELRMNEMLQMSNLKFTHFYKNKYQDYLKSLGNN